MKRFAWVILTVAVLSTSVASGQTTVETVRSITANSGLYSNRIAGITPPLAYTEVCFVDGLMEFDVHLVSEPTSGGNCSVGDVGWVIERDEREAKTWVDAKADCLTNQMRLAEPFEWGFSCNNQVAFELVNMVSTVPEWASNAVFPTRNSAEGGEPDRIQVASMGEDSCANTTAGLINGAASVAYRCVR